MDKLLLIDHSFHAHTKSVAFLRELLATKYELSLVYFNPENPNDSQALQDIKGKNFDCVVIFQLMPSLSWLRKYVSWKRISFFPMYDGIPTLSSPIWKEYAETKIISFSKTLYHSLKQRGFDVKYIQYFPKPFPFEDWGETDSVFYWQRVQNLPAQAIINALDNAINKIHIHTSMDPYHFATKIKTEKQLTTSVWFDTKEEMHKKILESALYIAPRLSEGIGMSFLEAMAMGRCVIAVNHPTMNEYIKNAQTGFLYDLDNVEKLNVHDIVKIQKNTFKYMQKGYKNWEKSKTKILKWIKSSVHSNVILKENKFFLFGKIPLFHWRKT